MKPRTATLTLCVFSALAWITGPAMAQQSSPPPLSLEESLDRARRVSPDIAAARAAIDAASARARQAGALTNPTLFYGIEKTSGEQGTSQLIIALAQRVELTGVRGARQDAAGLRREVAEARLRAVEGGVAFEVTRAYALALATDERMRLTARAASAFERAQRVTQARLAAGDVSGYEARRIHLEGTRYAAIHAEVSLAQRTAVGVLASLVGAPIDSLLLAGLVVPERHTLSLATLSRDSILTLATRQHPELLAARRQTGAALADARVAARERVPVPIASVGWKTEGPATGAVRRNGFVAGIVLPLPVWNRGGAAMAAADADARRLASEADVLRRRIAREADEAYTALRTAEEVVARLSPALGPEAAAALRAAEVAYGEGEITLVEWLDAVRAYHEAESILATLHAELIVRQAALVRATGTTPFEDRQP